VDLVVEADQARKIDVSGFSYSVPLRKPIHPPRTRESMASMAGPGDTERRRQRAHRNDHVPSIRVEEPRRAASRGGR
jgi:hypothetical protein